MEDLEPSRKVRPDHRRARGQAAESAADVYLQARGYETVARNWRCRSGEIDLIMQEGEVLVFVEVRSRRTSAHFGTAVEAVTPRKCAQVRGVAQVYLHQTGRHGRPVRFDVIAVTFSSNGEIVELRHLAGAF